MIMMHLCAEFLSIRFDSMSEIEWPVSVSLHVDISQELGMALNVSFLCDA